MRRRNMFWRALGAIVLVAGMAHPAIAHPYMVGDNWGDYLAMAQAAQGILDAMMSQYAGCPLWTHSCNGQTAIWATIIGQRGPAWVPIDSGTQTADHGASRTPGWGPERTWVRADYHWAFLEEALKPGACMEGVPPARIQEIRNAFNHNKSRVLSTEITVYGVRIRATVLGCDNDVTRDITTGGRINIPIRAGTPYPICSTVYTVDEGVPSLFGTANDGPLLNEAHPLLRDLLANMTAAYMTIGDSRVVDYWYAFMGRLALTFVRELLPGLVANIGKSADEETDAYKRLGDAIKQIVFESLREIAVHPDKNAKAVACQPWGFVDGVDISKNVCGLPIVGCITVRVTIPDSSVCLSIRTFADKFNCSAYICLPEYLGVKTTQGDLNADGKRNITSWFEANQNLQEWKVKEGVGGYLDIIQQPQPPSAPVNYGASFSMNVTGVSSVGIAYQWYAGYAPDALSPVPGATTRDFSPVVDVYSFNGDNRYKYYQVRLSAFYCGNINVAQSNVVQVQGGSPPSIQIFEHPVGGNFLPGDNVTLTVKAGVLAGPGLQYQWQKLEGGTWNDLPGKTSAVLNFPMITPADAGHYRVQVINQVAPSPVYWVFSNPAVVNVAPAITFTSQPVGEELLIGGNHTMTVSASVTAGNLEYRWQRDTGLGFQDLTPWVNAGGSSFSSDWPITNAQIADAGIYRCQVRNTLAPFGQYQKDSENATIIISSGTVFRVDKTAPFGNPENGLTWETAFKTLQPAIDAAYNSPGGGEVWVAGGTISLPLIYNEWRSELWGGYRGSLVMKSNVRVYGGFEGYRYGQGAREKYRDQRVIHQNRAIIDGSISRQGEPAFHVVVFGSATAPTVNSVLDGFTIQGGNASGVANQYHTWRGGGIYNWLSSPIIAHCRIINNQAAVSGGGIANEAAQIGMTWYPANATLINCIIQNNTAHRLPDGGPGPGGGNPLRGGGGIFNNGASPGARFLTIRDNILGAYTPPPDNNDPWGVGTGGIFSWAAPLTSGIINFNNSIVWNNTEGAIQFGRAYGSTADFVVDYCNLQNAWAGTGGNNSTANPNLDATSVPNTGSPVINTGDPNILAGEFADIRGIPRPVAARVDRGAVEVSTNGPAPACLIVYPPVDFIKKPKITNLFEVYNANATVSEAPIWKIQMEDKTLSCSHLPTTTLRVTVTDVLGRSAFCDALVHVTESQPPVPVVNPAYTTVNLLPQGQYTLTETDIWNIGATLSYDNCWLSSVAVVPSLFRCSQAGRTVFVSMLVMDGAGNPASQTIPIQVRDITDPVAVCSRIDIELNQFGQYTLSQDELARLGGRRTPPNPDLSTDACGIAWGLTSANMTSFSCAHVGAPVLVTVNVYDNHGNVDACIGEVNVLDVTPPTIYGARPKSFSTYGSDFTLEQALEGVYAEDMCDGDVSVNLLVEAFDLDTNPVPFPIPASYDRGGRFQYPFTLRYTCLDGSGNEAEVETIVNLYDVALPEITLNGPTYIAHECGGPYIDPGATAIDPATGGDISNRIDTTVSVSENIPGIYYVTYFILLEEYGLYVQEQRTVEVVDTLPPVLTMVGNPLMGVQVGTLFVDPGATAFDLCEGNLNTAIVVTGTVDHTTPGEYFLHYNVTDGRFDAEEKVRRILVGDLFVFLEHPVGRRMYTTDPPYTLTARYVNGLYVSGHEWIRNGEGLGVLPPETEGNTVELTIDPTVHSTGLFTYRLRAYDELGAYNSNPAQIEIQPPLVADLVGIELGEGVDYSWTVNVSGGLGTLRYQWYRVVEENKTLVPVKNGNYPHPTLGPGRYSGATTATLSMAPYTEAMAGTYVVEVSDDFTTIQAGPATLVHTIGAPAGGPVMLITLAVAVALAGTRFVKRRSR